MQLNIKFLPKWNTFFHSCYAAENQFEQTVFLSNIKHFFISFLNIS
jgi:hypothetical protein